MLRLLLTLALALAATGTAALNAPSHDGQKAPIERRLSER